MQLLPLRETPQFPPSNKIVAVESVRMGDGDDTLRVLTSDARSDSFAALILHTDSATAPAAPAITL